jgi:putative flippase GtrA
VAQVAAHTDAPARAVFPRSRVGRMWQSWPTVVRYGLAGGTTQVVYLCVLGGALVADVPYMAAVAAAQVVAICYAFPVYRRHVFVAEGPLPRQFLTFMGIWWTGAAMSFIGVPALVEGFGIAPFIAQLIVFIPIFTFSFLGHLRLTFKSSRPRSG